MTPFQQLRLWLRSAPAAERGTAAALGLVVVLFAAWALVPSGPNNAARVAIGGTVPGEATGSIAAGNRSSASASPSVGSALPASVASSGGSQAAIGSTGATAGAGAAAGTTSLESGTPGAAQAGATGPATPSAVPGATASSCTRAAAPMKLGLPILDIAGPTVNSAFNIPSPTEQQADWQAIVGYVNSTGGVDCHPLVGDYQSMNPADSTSGHTVCLQYVQDKVFAVLGYLSANATPGTGGDQCVVQNHIPLFHPQAMAADETAQYYPYLFGMERADILYRNFALAAGKLGWFGRSYGFAKLGIVYKNCQPSLNSEMVSDLEQAGVAASEMVRFDLGCPSGYAPPSSLEQAVLQFKNDGVTTVTFDEPGDPDLADFTRVAAAQLYKPRYVLPDDGLLLDTDHNTNGPDPSNFNGALAITPNQYGALNTSPALPVSPATATCDRILTKAGLPDTEHSDGGVAGVDCDMMWMFVAGATHAPVLAQNQIAAGLERAGTVPFSYPIGPNMFNSSDSTTGGQYWRPVQFDGACSCWKVTSAAFQPSFP